LHRKAETRFLEVPAGALSPSSCLRTCRSKRHIRITCRIFKKFATRFIDLSHKTTYPFLMSHFSENQDTSSFWNPELPYNQLPNIPPIGVELESKAVLKRCIDARTAVAELKQAAELIP